jgi:hypothetical protein
MRERRTLGRLALAMAALSAASCGNKKDAAPDAAPTVATATIAPTPTPTPPPPAAPPANSGGAAVAVPAGAPPPDGKYERVTVEGVTVPMIQVMKSGAVILVDTDGKKPRTWEEQYKRKRDLPNGQYDVHKTDTNKNDDFEDEKIDREGLWMIDAKGNVTKH